MKANPDKCHLLIVFPGHREIKIGNETIKNNPCEKFLRIEMNNKLRLNAHADDLCKRTTIKIHALAIITPYMTVLKRPILTNTFFRLQISYSPFLWICHSRFLNDKINKGNERCFKNCLTRTDLLQCTVVICKHMLWTCVKCT